MIKDIQENFFMTLKILNYFSGVDLRNILQKILKNSDDNLRFVIPSRKDRYYWYELINEKKINYKLWTWQNIYDEISISGNLRRKKILSPPDHFLILKNILNAVFIEEPEKIKAWPGLKRSGFPDVLSADIRELLNENVPPEKLNALKNDESPSGFILPEVYERYIKYLDNNNLIDSAQICTAALNALNNNPEWGAGLKIIFTGFLSFTHGQLELLSAIEQRTKNIIIIKPEAELKNFHDVNFQTGAKNFGRSLKKSAGKILEIPVAEPALEPENIARMLSNWYNSGGECSFDNFNSIGIFIPENYLSSVKSAFERYKIPYNLDRGVEISNTLVGHVLASVRNLSARLFPTYETSMLLSRKCFAGVEFDFMRAFRAGASGLDSWIKYLEKIKDEQALISMHAIKKFCEAMKIKSTPAKIMQAFKDFLTSKNLWLDVMTGDIHYSDVDEDIRTLSSVIQTLSEKVLSLNELLPDLGAVQDEKINNDDAYDFLETWCRHSLTRAPLKITNAVNIFTSNPPVLASFPIWIMLCVTQKSWSANIQSSPLLGNIERSTLAENQTYVPTGQDKAVQREALFRRLIHTGEILTIISRPELDDENRPVSASNFMMRFLEDFKDWNITTLDLASIKILDAGNFDVSQQKLNRYAPVIKHHAKILGVSDLSRFLRCPLQWYLKKRAGIYESRSELVNNLDWGNMAHKFWYEVWLKFRALKNPDGKEFIKLVNSEWDILSACENDTYENFKTIIKDFRLKRLLDGQKFKIMRLRDVQAGIIDNMHYAGFIHEKIMLEEEAQLHFDLNGVRFLGQCDKIEIIHEKRTGMKFAVISDYKEGSSSASENGIKILNYDWNIRRFNEFKFGLQISAYAVLFADNYPDINLGGVYFSGLKDGQISGSIIEPLQNIYKQFSNKLNASIKERSDEGLYAMECAADILNSNEFRPYFYDDRICRFCGLKSTCRRGEIKGDALNDNDDENDTYYEDAGD